MAKIRKGVAYRDHERPYTRKSRLRKKNYVRAAPNNHIVRFDMGDSSKEYDKKVVLIAKDPVQIRHNALEAGRKSANRTLELTLGKGMYHMRLRVYPHHILRENPMATGAGADRTSEGMKRAFGKPIGLAAQVDDGQVIAEANVKEKDLDVAKKALNKFKYKVPCTCSVEVKDWTE